MRSRAACTWLILCLGERNFPPPHVVLRSVRLARSKRGGRDAQVRSLAYRRPRSGAERRSRHPRAGAAAGRADVGLARVRGARARHVAGRRREIRQGAGAGHPDHHRPLRLQDARRQRSDQPARARHVPAGRDPRPERLLAGRGHGHRRPSQPDPRRARPAPRQRRPGELPWHRHAGSKTQPRLPGFYIISYADPENLEQVGDFVDLPAGHTVSCIDKCNYVWTGGHAARIRPTWAPSRRAVAATAGRSGSRISATRRARSCSRPDRPRPQRRADRLLARRRRRRQRHRVGQRSRWADGVCDPGPVA